MGGILFSLGGRSEVCQRATIFQIIGQGNPILRSTKKETTFILEWSDHSGVSGDISVFTSGYVPVIGATYRAGRSFTVDGNRYDGARVGIMPKALISSRTGALEI